MTHYSWLRRVRLDKKTAEVVVDDGPQMVANREHVTCECCGHTRIRIVSFTSPETGRTFDPSGAEVLP